MASIPFRACGRESSVSGQVRSAARFSELSDAARHAEPPSRSIPQEFQQIRQQLLGRLFGNEVATRQRMALDVIRLLPPRGDHVEDRVHLAELAPDGEHRTANTL